MDEDQQKTQTPAGSSAAGGSAELVAIMCPACACKERPHVIGWRCGGCSHALKMGYDWSKPEWSFCPWCGVGLVPPNKDSATPVA